VCGLASCLLRLCRRCPSLSSLQQLSCLDLCRCRRRFIHSNSNLHFPFGLPHTTHSKDAMPLPPSHSSTRRRRRGRAAGQRLLFLSLAILPCLLLLPTTTAHAHGKPPRLVCTQAKPSLPTAPPSSSLTSFLLHFFFSCLHSTHNHAHSHCGQ
jgi:hypothetical protein